MRGYLARIEANVQGQNPEKQKFDSDEKRAHSKKRGTHTSWCTIKLPLSMDRRCFANVVFPEQEAPLEMSTSKLVVDRL